MTTKPEKTTNAAKNTVRDIKINNTNGKIGDISSLFTQQSTNQPNEKQAPAKNENKEKQAPAPDNEGIAEEGNEAREGELEDVDNVLNGQVVDSGGRPEVQDARDYQGESDGLDKDEAAYYASQRRQQMQELEHDWPSDNWVDDNNVDCEWGEYDAWGDSDENSPVPPQQPRSSQSFAPHELRDEFDHSTTARTNWSERQHDDFGRGNANVNSNRKRNTRNSRDKRNNSIDYHHTSQSSDLTLNESYGKDEDTNYSNHPPLRPHQSSIRNVETTTSRRRSNQTDRGRGGGSNGGDSSISHIGAHRRRTYSTRNERNERNERNNGGNSRNSRNSRSSRSSRSSRNGDFPSGPHHSEHDNDNDRSHFSGRNHYTRGRGSHGDHTPHNYNNYSNYNNYNNGRHGDNYARNFHRGNYNFIYGNGGRGNGDNFGSENNRNYRNNRNNRNNHNNRNRANKVHAIRKHYYSKNKKNQPKSLKRHW